jgi:hypothetical protein
VTRLPKQSVPRRQRFPCESRYLRLASCEAAGLADGPRGAISAHRLAHPKASQRSLAASRTLPRGRAPVERALPLAVNRPVEEGFQVFSVTAARLAPYAFVTPPGMFVTQSPLLSREIRTLKRPSNLRSPSALSSLQIVALSRRLGSEKLTLAPGPFFLRSPKASITF